MSNPYISPFAKPVYVMLKPVGSVCNLACEYCYYLEKGKLYPEVKNHIMSEQLLEKFIKEYLECQTMPQVLFTWHGGETLMRPISFYRKALELQRKYGHRRQIDNCIQTNGTLLNDDWCRFFKENNFLVGVSIDGPQEFHDEYRRNKQGLPSFYKVMKGLCRTQKVQSASIAALRAARLQWQNLSLGGFKGGHSLSQKRMAPFAPCSACGAAIPPAARCAAQSSGNRSDISGNMRNAV